MAHKKKMAEKIWIKIGIPIVSLNGSKQRLNSSNRSRLGFSG